MRSSEGVRTVRIHCFDDAIKQATALPPGLRWSEPEEALAGDQPPCAIILRDESDIPRLAGALGQMPERVLPLIGLTGSLQRQVDVVIGPQMPTIAGALLALHDAMERVARLPSIAWQIQERAAGLLVHMAVREIGIEAGFDPNRPTITYLEPQDRLGDWVEAEAERLVGWGMLDSRFVEQLNVCPACASGRLLIREECPSCRSTDVVDESIIHHFRCAEQAPERQFRQGSELVCPKCRQYLRHFSVDYDKPAVTLLCQACNHHTGEPSIGFRCLDCGRSDSTERLMTRRVKSYALTQRGRASAFDAAWLQGFAGGRPAHAPSQGAGAFAGAQESAHQTLLELRLVQRAQTGWRWFRPGTRSSAQERSKHLAQRLVREYFPDTAIECLETPNGFDVRIDRSYDWVAPRIGGLDGHLREFVAEPAIYEISAKPWQKVQAAPGGRSP